MISLIVRPDFTKSSVFSLTSIAMDIKANRNNEKKKVVSRFLNMYQSSFFMPFAVPSKIEGSRESLEARMLIVTYALIMLKEIFVLKQCFTGSSKMLFSYRFL